MALDAVKSEIDKSAEESVAAIMAKASAEVAEISALADAEISAIGEKGKKRLKDAIERLRRQEISSAELESKRIVLAKKKEIFSRLFSEVLESLKSSPADVKLAQYREMIRASQNLIKNPRVHVAPGEKITAKDLGISSVTKDDKVLGGIIIENEDQSVRIDMQYETILRTIWDREIKKLSDILFG